MTDASGDKAPTGSDSFGAFAALGSEALFTILPFVVTGIVFFYKGSSSKLFYMPEWSLAASVLFGQTLVKYISGILSSRGKIYVEWEAVALLISIIMVFGLVPSLIVLSLVLITEETSRGLAITQVILFVVALGSFFLFAGVGHSPRGGPPISARKV